jgi:hypothetical protein
LVLHMSLGQSRHHLAAQASRQASRHNTQQALLAHTIARGDRWSARRGSACNAMRSMLTKSCVTRSKWTPPGSTGRREGAKCRKAERQADQAGKQCDALWLCLKDLDPEGNGALCWPQNSNTTLTLLSNVCRQSPYHSSFYNRACSHIGCRLKLQANSLLVAMNDQTRRSEGSSHL